MHEKLLVFKYFSNNKALMSSTYTSYITVKKISIGMFKKKSSFFRVWLYWKQLGSLKGSSHSPRCCWHVRSLFSFCVCMLISIFILCLYDRGGWRGMRRTKLDMNTSVSLTKRKFCECVCTKFKLTKS